MAEPIPFPTFARQLCEVAGLVSPPAATEGTSLDDLGADSLARVLLVAHVEDLARPSEAPDNEPVIASLGDAYRYYLELLH